MYEGLTFDARLQALKDRLRAERTFKINSHGKFCFTEVGNTWDLPWVLVGNPRRKFCYHYLHVYTELMNLIPKFCRFHCWKVVAKPRTLKETVGIYGIMQHLGLPGKVGMDVRSYTYGAWAAFWYADTLEEAREYYRHIRREVDRLSADLPVIVKRGCTEMEILQRSKTWEEDYSEEDKALERILEDRFEFEEFPYNQSDWQRQETMERWVKQAIQIGDPTAREMAESLTGDSEIWSKLVSHPDTYHEEAEQENQ